MPWFHGQILRRDHSLHNFVRAILFAALKLSKPSHVPLADGMRRPTRSRHTSMIRSSNETVRELTESKSHREARLIHADRARIRCRT
jgi:hypothetical protein